MSDELRVSILAPRKERTLVINGWSVPLLEAHEEDGGSVLFVLDGRLGCSVPVAEFDRVASFLADTIATCFGYGAHPRDDDFDRRRFDRVPHPTLAPHRVHEITAAE